MVLQFQAVRLVYNPTIKLRADKRIILDLLNKGAIEFICYIVEGMI